MEREAFLQELESQLLAEKDVILRGGMPAFQMLLAKFDQEADRQLLEYDKCNFLDPKKAIKIQVFRWMIKKEIPRMLENIVNVDKPKETPWNFRQWLNNFVKSRMGRKG